MFDRISWRLFFILAVSIAYLPFFNSRMLPTAGDDKVYMAQALEMLEHGRHFVQSLFDQPNYFKGPLHYLLVQGGHAIFGLKPIAARYMNFIFVVLAGLSIGTVVERHVAATSKRALALWAALACIFSAGTIGHVFPSQMEVELLAFYSLALALLDRSENPRHELGFWIVAGLAGWLKSPVHSALLGLSFFLYYGLLNIFQKDPGLRTKIRSLRSWSFCLVGVLVCISGYLPAIIQDWPHFLASYIERENLSKSGGNGGPGWQSWLPLFFYYLYPWNWLALALYGSLIPHLFRPRVLTAHLAHARARPYLLVASVLAPIVTFFWVHPYRGENYTYPAQGAVFVLLALLWERSRRSRALGFTHWLTAIQLLLPAAAAAWMFFPTNPSWLPKSAPWVILFLASASTLIVSLGLRRAVTLGILGLVPFVLSINLLLYWLGEREMTGIRQYLLQEGSRSSLCYLNLDKNIWNEAGGLSFALGTRVKSCHDSELANRHLLQGGTLIVSNPEWLDQLRASPEWKSEKLVSTPWVRWGRHAHIPSGGRSPLIEVRESGDWKHLERELLLVSRAPDVHQ
jgi:4-amino-4-deoxy-L-arabinose transferase-like glycosyltransferase